MNRCELTELFIVNEQMRVQRLAVYHKRHGDDNT